MLSVKALGVAVKALWELARLARPARAPAPTNRAQWLMATKKVRARVERAWVWSDPRVQAGLEGIRASNRQAADVLERLWAHPRVQAALRVYQLLPKVERGRTMPPGPTQGWQVRRVLRVLLAWLQSSQEALQALVKEARLAPELPNSPARAERVEAPPPIPPPFLPSKTTVYTNAPNK